MLNGLCTQCGQHHLDKTWLCGPCRKKQDVATRRRRSTIPEGFCRDCRNPAVEGRTGCVDCLARNAANTKQLNFEAKIAAFAAYGGCFCKCCSEDQLDFLTLDHVNGDGAEHRRAVGRGGTAFYQWLRRNNYPNDPPLEVLCWNCNIGRYRNSGVCPHSDGRND